jgi:hypothetical protein
MFTWEVGKETPSLKLMKIPKPRPKPKGRSDIKKSKSILTKTLSINPNFFTRPRFSISSWLVFDFQSLRSNRCSIDFDLD